MNSNHNSSVDLGYNHAEEEHSKYLNLLIKQQRRDENLMMYGVEDPRELLDEEE